MGPASDPKPGEGVEARGVEVNDVGRVTQAGLVPRLGPHMVEGVWFQALQIINTALG